MWMPKIIQNVVREAVEPLLIGANLLHRINYSFGQTISFGAIGAMYAADIAEGQEYPERKLNIAGGTVTCTVGKSGRLRLGKEHAHQRDSCTTACGSVSSTPALCRVNTMASTAWSRSTKWSISTSCRLGATAVRTRPRILASMTTYATSSCRHLVDRARL